MDETTVQFLMKNLSRTPQGNFEWKSNMPAILAAYDQLNLDIASMHPYLGPVLFIRGERSDYVKDADLTTIRHFFPEASLVTIPGAGHWVHADNPDDFTREILQFLGNSKASTQ